MPDLILSLRDGLAAYRTDKARILKDPDLSEKAKKKRAAALREERLAALTAAGERLWRALESDFNVAEEAVRAARASANKGWDFGRLMYEARAVESLLVGVRDVGEIKDVYDRLTLAGDPYQRRAAAETWPAILAKMDPLDGGRAGLGSLLNQLRRDAAELQRTPAVTRAETEAGAVLDRIMAARDATQAVLSEFGVGGSFLGTSRPHPLAAWLNRTRVGRRMLQDGAGRQEITVEFLPAAA